MNGEEQLIKALTQRAAWVRRETLRLHRLAPGTRIASSLSPVEIFTVLYYGGILRHDGANPQAEGRDRFLVSKAHGSISLFPILADRGFFKPSELDTICSQGSLLGSIPDPTVRGYETINGSLGHGLGVGAGMAVGLKVKRSERSVFVLTGDGELHEGSVWEAVMFAAERGLDNLILIIDNNGACMLDYCKNILRLEPLERKFAEFGWEVERVDGHDLGALHASLTRMQERREGRPKAIIADTVKGRGVPRLEQDPLCHIKSLSPDEVDRLLEVLP